MTVRHADADYHVLASPDTQLIVHAIPPAIAATFEITTPPVLREDAAIKPFFTVSSLAAARARACALGGDVFEEEWEGPDRASACATRTIPKATFCSCASSSSAVPPGAALGRDQWLSALAAPGTLNLLTPIRVTTFDVVP